MALKSPNLDDRDFNQLLEEARRWIVRTCPQWTDLSPHDPGMVILELFAHLTETMIYRLNRLPEKAYIEFLRLMGVKLNPPIAASVKLRFTLNKSQNKPTDIPKGVRVTLSRAGGSGEPPPVFVTRETVTIPAGKTEIETIAHNCDVVVGELAGFGTGLPGLTVTAKRAPIVAPTDEALELIVGVEAKEEELSGRVQALKYDGKAYRIWREVENFSNLRDRRFVYLVDRMTGVITFAPAVQLREKGQLSEIPQAIGEMPSAGREIRLWYCHGGGPGGNVAVGTLTTMKDPLPGITVNNPEPATGGRTAETLQNALLRGPHEFHSLQRAVTASDFELLALSSSGAVARAKAFTKAMLWVYAPPGAIEVLLVPYVPEELRAGGRVTEEQLKSHETQEALQAIRSSLDERRPLGTTCLVNWVRYKNVRVEARAVVHRGEDPDAVQARVLTRLHQNLSPLPSNLPSPGWPFGQPLRASHVYDIILAEPGVNYADQVRLLVDEVPDKDISSLAADATQPHTWYAATGTKLFRSMDDADGWELISNFPNEEVQIIRVNPHRPGMLAIVSGLGEKGSRLYLSEDCGESWRPLALTAFAIHDMAWTSREGDPLLLLATDDGLYEQSLQPGTSPIQVLVDPARPKLGFYAIAASTGIRGTFFVAVAARGAEGVFLSSQGGKPSTFSHIGLKGENIQVLEVQQDGVRTFLWAGITVSGGEPGRGCFKWELQGSQPPAAGVRFERGWDGGSCHALAFKGSYAFAATHQKGVLWLDTSKGDEATWHAPVLGSGLPQRDVERLFHPVRSVAADPAQRLVLAGGRLGIYCSSDNGTSYRHCSSHEFREKVTLPSTWLFCSGTHTVQVTTEDAPRRD